MALKAKFNDTEFGVGDKIRVVEVIKEGDKKRLKNFDGTVLSIRGEKDNKTFTIRKIGSLGIGIERIFPINCPSIAEIKVIKKATRGVRHAKLFFLRDRNKRKIDRILLRSARKK